MNIEGPTASWVSMIMDRLHTIEKENDKMREENAMMKIDNERMHEQLNVIQHAQTLCHFGKSDSAAPWRIILIDGDLHFQHQSDTGWFTTLSLSSASRPDTEPDNLV